MAHKFLILPPIIAALAGCGTIDPSIELPPGAPAVPEFVVEVDEGSVDSFRGVDLDVLQVPLEGEASELSFDEEGMAQEPNDTFRVNGPPMTLGTRIEATWEAGFQAPLSFGERKVTRTRKAHIGHDIALTGLGLIDVDGDPLDVTQNPSPFLQGCRVIGPNEQFSVVLLANNLSFTSVPVAALRTTLIAQGQASATPTTQVDDLNLPAESQGASIVLGPFTVSLQGGANQGAVEIAAGVDDNQLDFEPRNNDIGAQQSAATGNPNCFGENGEPDRERCQTCLIVQG